MPLLFGFQTPSGPAPEKAPAFEVASVKSASAPISTKDEYSAGYNAGMRAALAQAGMRITGQRVNITDNSLQDLIRIAFQLKDYQIVGPAWIATEKYQVTANMPAGTNRSQAPAMLQDLLETRFHLQWHKETRQTAVYALVAAKGGVKLTPPSNPPNARGSSAWNPGRLRGMNLTLAAFADVLGKATDRPVIDATQVAGVYDFDLTYAAELAEAAAEAPPSLAEALALIGLKLEKREVPIVMWIVDRADKIPTGN